MTGYGSVLWGGFGWGTTVAPILGVLDVADVLVVRENLLRTVFTAPVMFTGLGDPTDSESMVHYSIASVAGTIGWDDVPVRTVTAVLARRSLVTDVGAALDGYCVDITLDRPMSPYPAQYALTILNVYIATGGVVTPPRTVTLSALYRMLQPPAEDQVVRSTDIAQPQGKLDFSDPIGAPDVTLLGSFAVDDTGDYATDDGDTSLRKRILRRLITRKDAFAHLPGYGIGVLDEAKRLNTAATRGRLSAEAERQIGQEPEVQKCVVSFYSPPDVPGLTRMRILVKTQRGTAVKLDVPFSTV